MTVVPSRKICELDQVLLSVPKQVCLASQPPWHILPVENNGHGGLESQVAHSISNSPETHPIANHHPTEKYIFNLAKETCHIARCDLFKYSLFL